jgi:hypothetical protein
MRSFTPIGSSSIYIFLFGCASEVLKALRLTAINEVYKIVNYKRLRLELSTPAIKKAQ